LLTVHRYLYRYNIGYSAYSLHSRASLALCTLHFRVVRFSRPALHGTVNTVAIGYVRTYRVCMGL